MASHIFGTTGYALFRICAYTIIISLAPEMTHGQSEPLKTKIKFRQLDLPSGLSNLNVIDILQDRYGYIWIATEDGLDRFDGYEIKVYRNNPNDTLSLLRNTIKSLFEDSSGKLWVVTRGGGVHVYDRSQDKFKRIGPFNNNCNITKIYEDDLHHLWAIGSWGARGAVGKIDTTSYTVKPYEIVSGVDEITSMLQHNRDEYWIGARDFGLVKWNSKTYKTERFLPDQHRQDAIAGKNIVEIVKDQRGDIWIATQQGLSKLNSKTKTFRNFLHMEGCKNCVPVNVLYDLCVDGNYLWIGTENGGLSKLNMITEEFVNFHYDRNNPFSICDNSIWCVYKDHQNRIWAGTFSSGLCVLDEQSEKFSELDMNLPNNIVNAIYEDHLGRIWIATEGGVGMNDHGKTSFFTNDGRPGSLTSGPVLSIFEDSGHQLWFGTWKGGLNKYDEKSGRFLVLRSDHKNNPSDWSVWAITELKKSKKLVVASYSGLKVLDNLGETLMRTIIDSGTVANNYVSTLFEDSRGDLWVGSISELNKVNVETGDRERFALDVDGGQSAPMINFITEDSRGRIWVGTNRGLYLFIQSKPVQHFTTNDGLPTNVINGILEAGDGTLWISTTGGLSNFDPEGTIIRNYFVADGLPSNAFKPRSCVKSKDQLLFFGGKGVIVFDPLKIKINKNMPPVYITGLQVSNKPVKPGDLNSILSKDISVTKEISLPESLNFFSIEYAAINLSVSKKNQYAYQLKGFNDEWIYVGSQRSATFTNLEPGTYTFRVKASNNDYVWNEESADITIHIIPKWYKSIFFKVAASIFFSFLLVGFYRLRITRAEQRRRQLEDLVSKRTSELRMLNEKLTLHELEITMQNDQLVDQGEKLTVQNEKLMEQAEELNMQNETLRHSKIQQLELFKRKLVERADIHEKISTELQDIRDKYTLPVTERGESFDKILQSYMMTESDWESFKAAFNEVYPSFFASVRYQFPEITSVEIRLTAMIKLNLSAKETAYMLGVSADNILKLRYLLKKRLEINEDDSLEVLIQKIN